MYIGTGFQFILGHALRDQVRASGSGHVRRRPPPPPPSTDIARSRTEPVVTSTSGTPYFANRPLASYGRTADGIHQVI